MKYMFEVIYELPEELDYEKTVIESVAAYNGILDYREVSDNKCSRNVILTFEFSSEKDAINSATTLRETLEAYIEGPMRYAD